MGTARDIALIFLSLEALVVALIPLVLIGGLAYGVYRLHRVTKVYLQKAQVYAQRANDFVEEASHRVAAPFILAHSAASMISTMVSNLLRRGL
ncbi:MAG: hypothetical protein ACP5JG_16800 [Anaerolineae bacterium]